MATKEMKTKKVETIDDIIKNHVIYAMTAGAIPIPLVDFVAISAIQLDMIKNIAEFYSADYDSSKGKSLASSLVGTSFAKLGASAVKALPGIGTVLGIAAQVLLAGGSTYALGKVFDTHFSGGKSLNDFNVDGMKKKYKEFLEKGREFARSMKSGIKNDDIFDTIEKLKKLHENGAITDEDFEKTKKELLKKISS